MIKLAILGLGNLPRAFLQILQKRPLPFPVSITGVATGSHGCIIATHGVSPASLLEAYAQGQPLSSCGGSTQARDAFDMMSRSGADVVLLCTPLNPKTAEPGLSYCRFALNNRQSVISVDKGPIAFACNELTSLAKERGAQLRYEGIVMDGMPIFSLAERLLPGVEILGFEGVLNSTSGIAMQSMEEGKTFEEGVLLAQQLGIAEADPSNDLDGFDSQVKACALANALLGAKLTPPDVKRQPMPRPSVQEVQTRLKVGEVLRYISSGKRNAEGEVEASVESRWLPVSTILGMTRGAASVLVLHTDLMGEIALYERDPQIEQSAYALYLDLVLYRDVLYTMKSSS